MKKIDITIPSGLNQSQEIVAIAKHLSKKLLPSGKKLIGNEIEVAELETQINIKRKVKEKPMAICSVCACAFEKKHGKQLWVNYGGMPKQKRYCSDSCRDTILELVGTERASINRKGVKNQFFFLSR